MQKTLWLLLTLFFIINANAYELNGTMQDNNDGTFAVTLQSNTGYEYIGTANVQGDGTLLINVVADDEGRENYLGIARPSLYGYRLELRNNASGELATGILAKE